MLNIDYHGANIPIKGLYIMSVHCRVIIQTYDPKSPAEILRESEALDIEVIKPTDCLNISIGMNNHIQVIHKVQDHILLEKMKLVDHDHGDCCPKCQHKLNRVGYQDSPLNDVFTDHTVYIRRIRCSNCDFKTPSTVNQLIGTTMTGELTKIQSELGAKHTFREAEDILDIFSHNERRINNHDRIKKSSELVGNNVAIIKEAEKEIIAIPPAKELILNVDGGYINTKEDGKRSMEALTSVIYRPESVVSNSKDTRNNIISKHCAASVKNDNQEEIMSSTIIAALKQGLHSDTKVTALCDGAANCWRVVEAIKPLCGEVICILDWFHIAMKMQNISLPEELKSKFMRVKWHLWRGNTEMALLRIRQLIESINVKSEQDKLLKFETYIHNNHCRIVNYRDRQKNNLVFTSNLAESTVESLINKRCKGQQHMRWTRDGLEPILQIRAALSSQDEWNNMWRTAVLNAA